MSFGREANVFAPEGPVPARVSGHSARTDSVCATGEVGRIVRVAAAFVDRQFRIRTQQPFAHLFYRSENAWRRSLRAACSILSIVEPPPADRNRTPRHRWCLGKVRIPGFHEQAHGLLARPSGRLSPLPSCSSPLRFLVVGRTDRPSRHTSGTCRRWPTNVRRSGLVRLIGRAAVCLSARAMSASKFTGLAL